MRTWVSVCENPPIRTIGGYTYPARNHPVLKRNHPGVLDRLACSSGKKPRVLVLRGLLVFLDPLALDSLINNNPERREKVCTSVTAPGRQNETGPASSGGQKCCYRAVTGIPASRRR